MTKSLPNILLIMSDQHRYDAMGCAGHPVIQTPNLDRLAQEGFLLERVYCQGPVCMPARFSFLTGRYVHDHGTWFNFSQPSPQSPTFLNQLQAAGYHTAMIGKTHLWVQKRGEDVNFHTQEMRQWGFDETEELAGKTANLAVNSPYVEWIQRHGLFEQYRERIHRSAQRGQPLWHSEPFPLPEEYYPDAYVGQKAVEWLRSYNRAQPFCFWVGFPGPHDPYDAPQRYADLYPPQSLSGKLPLMPGGKLPPYVELVLKAISSETLTGSALQQIMSFYYGNITLIDEWIGRIVDVLIEQGWDQNTWVIYTSDHGEMLGEHRLLQKLTFYEGATRVPALIRPPTGLKTPNHHPLKLGQTLQGRLAHFDLPHTMLDLVGIEPQFGSQGISFKHTLMNSSAETPSYSPRSAVFSEIVGYSMVVADGFKYVIEAKSHQPMELYNLDVDPNEMLNLADNPSFDRTRQHLEETYLQPFLQDWDPKRLTRKESIEAVQSWWMGGRRDQWFAARETNADPKFNDGGVNGISATE